MTIHINLVSNQLLPNVIPTLSQGVNDIEKIYLVTAGTDFENSAHLLKTFYESKGVEKVELYRCEDPNDYYALRYKAKDLYLDIKCFYPNAFVALNATGGTKPMSIAFTQEFDHLADNSMALYTDTLSKKVIILNDADNLPDLPYHSVLSVQDYFTLSNFKLKSCITLETNAHEILESREMLSKALLVLGSQQSSCIAQLNAIAQQTNFAHSNMNLDNEITFLHPISAALTSILTMDEAKQFVTLYNKSLYFYDENAIRYFAGGWLEEIIYLAALEAGVEHVAMDLLGTQNNAENQLDVVLTNNNQMLIIEAKTLDWSKGKKGQNEILKLEGLTQHFGGSLGKSMFISLFPSTTAMDDRIANIRGMSFLKLTNYEDLLAYLVNWKNSTL